MLQDYITPDFRKVMEENGLVIRRITLWCRLILTYQK
jgi:hypothetical protein